MMKDNTARRPSLKSPAFVIFSLIIIALLIASAVLIMPKLAAARHEFSPLKWRYALGNARELIYRDMLENYYTVAPSPEEYDKGAKYATVIKDINKGDLTYEYKNRPLRIDVGYKLSSSPLGESEYLILEFYDKHLTGYYVTRDYSPQDVDAQ